MERFTDKEVKEIQRIFWRLEPKTIYSIQIYDEKQMYSTGRTFGDPDRNRTYSWLFQNFNNFTPVRKKIFEKMKKCLPYEPEIYVMKNDIVRIVWKSSGVITKF